ncbi:endoglycoceramidase [Lepeophtheirus salmonis]
MYQNGCSTYRFMGQKIKMDVFIRFIMTFELLASFSTSGPWTQALPNDKILINPETGHFVDSLGRVRIFRGINAVQKGEPWYPSWLLDENYIKLLSEMGFNVVRLGTMWSGLQSDGPTSQNRTYIDILKTITTNLGEKGIYSILDMHQDVLWNLYYGFPKWVKDSVPPPDQSYPAPMNHITPAKWACGYFTKDTNEGFQHLYNNTNGIGDYFANFWSIIAEEFKDYNEILGYDLLNEPWVGNAFEDSSYMLPGIGGEKNIAPLFEKAAKKIWSIQNDAVIFFEGATWGTAFPIEKNSIIDKLLFMIFRNIDFKYIMKIVKPACDSKKGMPSEEELREIMTHVKEALSNVNLSQEIDQKIDTSVLGPGYKTVPGGANYRNRTVLSWHHYCPIAGRGTQTSFLEKIICFHIVGPAAFKSVGIRLKELGGTGSMLTEFGLCTPDIKNPDLIDTAACNFVMTNAEDNFESWNYWDAVSSLGVFIDSEGH